MIIDDIKPSISELPRDEALDLVLARRESRMTRKKKSSSKKKKAPPSLDEIISTMNTEQAAEFLEKLQKQAKK